MKVRCELHLPPNAFPLPGGGFGIVPPIDEPAEVPGELGPEWVRLGYVDDSDRYRGV